ncbi:MFS transporter [Actinoplanes sp. NPDC051859]|uniref:MFS transporter n=1 Tax=Actinoplanes sp. NPDC051859 TaxID=3363909 RepID=UPI0037B84CEE
MTLLRELVPAPGPGRRLVVLATVQAAGNGLFLTSSAVFLVRVAGLAPTEVGLGLSGAGLAGLLTTVPLGRLADRHGARRLLVLVYAALALLFVAYPMVRSFGSFLVVAALVTVAETAGSPLRAAVLRSLVDTTEALTVRAQMRGGFNVGFLLGAGAAGVVLATPNATAFAVVSVVNALAHVACAVVARTLRAAPVPKERRGGTALRDVRFVLLAAVNGVLETHVVVLTLGLPLWIVTHTRAPAGLTAALVIANTVLVLLLQVRLSRRADTVFGAAGLLRRSGLVLAVGCLICAASAAGGPLTAVAVLLVGTATLAIGEMWQSAGAWGLAFELALPAQLAEYQAVFGLGRGFGQFVGPALVTALLAGGGPPGWAVLAVIFASAGVVAHRIAVGAPQAQDPGIDGRRYHSGRDGRRTTAAGRGRGAGRG